MFGSRDGQASCLAEELLLAAPSPSGMTFRCRNDLRRTVLEVSESCESLTGYLESEFLSNAAPSYADLIHEDDLGSVIAAVSEAASAERAFEVAYRLRHKSGQWQLVREQGWCHRGADGKLIVEGSVVTLPSGRSGIRGMECHDVAEQFRTLFSGAATGMLMISRDCRIEDANDSFCTMLGYTLEELRQADLCSVVHIDDVQSVIAASNAILRGRTDVLHIETRYLHKQGREVAARVSCSGIRDFSGTVQHIVAMIENVTEKKRARAQLRASEERFKRLFEGGSVGMALIDPNTNAFVDVNRAMLQIFNCGRKEVIGRKLHDILAEVETAEPDAIREAEAHDYSFESKHVRPDGAITWGRTTISTVRDENDRPILKLLMFTDITDRKGLEEQLNKAQRMETIGQLAGGVAHDFNNLLLVINGYATVLAENLGEDTPLGKKARLIEKAGLRAANLTSQLLAFSRRQVLSPKVVNVDALITGFESMISRIIGEDIELVTRLESVESRISIDPGQLEQVLMNLVVNARDAMPEGGRLSIETRVVTLEQEEVANKFPMRPGTFVLIAVSDTGQGMTPTVKGRIFEPFFTTKEVGKGTGLGLSTVYGIVRQSGGFVWVQTEPGVGSTFEIYLPIDRRTSREEPEQTKEKRLRKHRGTDKILLVEDEQTVRDMLGEMLSALGYDVTSAGNGQEALNILRSGAADIKLVVTDSVMPVLGGRELTKQLRNEFPEIKVLLISGYAAKKFDDAVIDGPQTAFLQKPFALATLSQAIRELMDGKAEEVSAC